MRDESHQAVVSAFEMLLRYLIYYIPKRGLQCNSIQISLIFDIDSSGRTSPINIVTKNSLDSSSWMICSPRNFDDFIASHNDIEFLRIFNPIEMLIYLHVFDTIAI